MITTASPPSRLPARPSISTTRHHSGTRRCWTTRPGQVARSSTRPATAISRRINSTASSANLNRASRAPATPAVRSCSKAASTGRRCPCHPRTSTPSKPATPQRAKSHSLSACPPCCSPFPATTRTRIIRRRTAPSGAKPFFRSPTALPMLSANGSQRLTASHSNSTSTKSMRSPPSEKPSGRVSTLQLF
jgi:hypothetical protein